MKSFAQQAYEAANSYRVRECGLPAWPIWEEIGDTGRGAWECAAIAVMLALKRGLAADLVSALAAVREGSS